MAPSHLFSARPRTAHRRARPCLALLLAAIVAHLTGCADLLGPGRDARPQLQALAFDDLFTNLQDGGLMYIDAVPTDTAFRLGTRQRVPIEIAVSSGDHESAGLYRAYCPFTDRIGWGHFYCFRFDIYMQPSHDVRALAGRVAAIDGRFDLLSATGFLGAVTLFSPDQLVSRAREAQTWPGVDHTALSFPFCSVEPGVTCLPFQVFLSVPLPVDTGSAIRDDGIVQVRTGDTVTVTYRQPSGQTLRAQVVVP